MNTNFTNRPANDMNQRHRQKRFIRRLSAPAGDSYSITYSESNLIIGTILVVIVLIFTLLCICKSLAEFLDPPVTYEIPH